MEPSTPRRSRRRSSGPVDGPSKDSLAVRRRTAAMAVTLGIIPNTAEAGRQYSVSPQSLNYWKKKDAEMPTDSKLAFWRHSGALAKDEKYRPRAEQTTSVPSPRRSPRRRSKDVADMGGAAERRGAYRNAYALCGTLLRAGGHTVAQAIDKAYLEHGYELSRGTASAAKKRTDDHPYPLRDRGRQPLMPLAMEDNLVDLVLELRKHSITTSRSVVMYAACTLLQGTEAAECFQTDDGTMIRVPSTWYDSFVLRHGDRLRPAEAATTESKRVQWSKSKYLRSHYDLVEDELVKAGICQKNPDFNPNSDAARASAKHPDNQPIIWNSSEAGRVISFDETYWSPDGVTSRSEKILIGTHENPKYVEVRVNKSAERCTIVGGSAANGDAIQPMIIYKGKSIKVEQFVGFPGSMGRVDADTGKPFPAVAKANESGGMTNDMAVEYLDEVIAPFTAADRRQGKTIIMIVDGHGSHVTVAFLRRCVELGIVLILRIPHTTHLTQGEDVENFGKFKRKANNQQKIIGVSYAVAAMLGHRRDDQVTMDDFMPIAAGAWREAFAPETNIMAWYKIGIKPFSRKPMMDLYRQEFENEQSLRRGAKAKWEARSLKDVFPVASNTTLPATLVGKRVQTGELARSQRPATDAGVIGLLLEKDQHMEAKRKRAVEGREEKEAKRRKMAEIGSGIWSRVLDDKLKLDDLKVPELNAVGVHKGIKFTTTRVKADGTKPLPIVGEKRAQLREAYRTDLPESQWL